MKKFLLSMGALLTVVGCHKIIKVDPNSIPQESANAPAVIPAGLTSPTTIQVTFEGDNGESYFSPDGKRLIFQSKQRPAHKNSQIYIFDLETKKEKRITFNDGDDTCAYFSPHGKRIIYASTTDEIKERPEPLATSLPPKTEGRKYEWKFLNYEIYSADPDGSHIKRLTKSPGYDAEGVFSYDGKKILFTSIRDGDLELYSMDADGRNQSRLTFTKGYDGGGFYSPNGKKIVWRGFHDEKGSAQIYVADSRGKNVKALTTKEAIHWCPFWHPDGKKIIFSSNRGQSKQFELYQINADGTCLKKLAGFSGAANILPAFSPDGKKIAFTSNRSGTNQIYIMDYVEPKDCLPETP